MSEPEIIIAEKDQQGEILARVLGLRETTRDIEIPNKEFMDLDKRIPKIRAKLEKKQEQIDALELAHDKDRLREMKKYETAQRIAVGLRDRLKVLEEEQADILSRLETFSVRYWTDDDRFLVACSGHLLDIAFKSKKELEAEDLESEETDAEETDGEETEESELGLRFETKLRPPSPLDAEGKQKYARFRLIEILLSENDFPRYICATDYDREGQSIFGSLLEYFEIDFDLATRMRFSSLEGSVLLDAYNHQIPFEMGIFESGKARRWLDYVVGFNLSPPFSRLYTAALRDCLEDLDIAPEQLKSLIYNSFNVGRVKLVILNYIYQHTNDQIESASTVENGELESKEIVYRNFEIVDKNNNSIELLDDKNKALKGKEYNYDAAFTIKINKNDIVEEKRIFNDADVPQLPNMTRIFDICADLGASADQVNRILEYLYLQQLISYPRSKSNQWNIPDPTTKAAYVKSVLDTMLALGYPIIPFYYSWYGNEGTEKYLAHQCIHPLPSVTAERIASLKAANPLAYLVFNKICVEIMKCFEQLPKLKIQKIDFTLSQDGKEIGFLISRIIGVLEPNILNFEGLDGKNVDTFAAVDSGDVFEIVPRHQALTSLYLDKNHSDLEILSDFDVIHYLNEADIGTDATRTVILTTLIDLQYLVSSNILLTTILGNILSILADNYVNFINEEYTLEMEADLNRIEKGELDREEFDTKVKELITKTCRDIYEHADDIKELYLDMLPKCEVHGKPMIIRSGKFGKFIQCPRFFTEEKCKQTLSLL